MRQVHKPHRLHLQVTLTPEEFHARLEPHVRAYLDLRAAGHAPLAAARVTVANSFPRSRANRAAHVVSVFMMFAERNKPTMERERDLVLLMLACISMGHAPFPPGSPNNETLARTSIEVLNEYWFELDHLLDPDAHTNRNTSLAQRASHALTTIAHQSEALSRYINKKARHFRARLKRSTNQ